MQNKRNHTYDEKARDILPEVVDVGSEGEEDLVHAGDIPQRQHEQQVQHVALAQQTMGRKRKWLVMVKTVFLVQKQCLGAPART